MFEQMGAHIETLDQRVATADDELAAQHKANPVSQLLAGIPGVGPLGAITMALTRGARELRVREAFRRMVGPDAEGTFHRRQATHGQDQQGWQ